MEPSRFDRLTKVFARPASRRRTLAGVVAALIPAATAAKPEPAKCLAIGKRCSQPAGDARPGTGKHGGKGGKGKHHPPSCAKCCSRFGAAGSDGKARCACKADGEACANPSQCCGGLCRNGACTKCPGALTVCDGNCVDLQTDHDHCGDCANPCASGQRCVGGTCVCDGTSCPRGCCAKDGSCQRGTDDAACGIGGADCQTCATCTTCDGTTCANATACCGDTSVCQSGTCAACAQGQRCQRGACVCDATSCPDGCCDGDHCVVFADQSDQQCGTNGAACKGCADPDTCGGGDPGTPGVCGCTPQCAGKCNGESDSCGGTCGCEHGLICDGDACVCGSTPPGCPRPCGGPYWTTDGCKVCSSINPDCGGDLPRCFGSADCAANAACAYPGNDQGNSCPPDDAKVCIPVC